MTLVVLTSNKCSYFVRFSIHDWKFGDVARGGSSLGRCRTLATIDNEPRILDTDLAVKLGMSRPTNIRQIIKKHMDELTSFGLVHTTSAPYTSGRGRVAFSDAYYLNEEQALLLCILSETERAKQVRAEVIKVFSAWRRGELVEAVLAALTVTLWGII